jgi:23S rRNA (guanosine2251-2'-O)-methyltransferase
MDEKDVNNITCYYNENVELRMAEPQYKFYECKNPACGLRFPGSEGYPRWNLCPVCRSKIREVEVVQRVEQKTNQITLHEIWQIDALLDNIRSAWNVGSIFRISDGTGIRKLHLCGITPTPKSPKVGKTALGAEANVPWEQSNNGLKTTSNLKSLGYKIWVLENLPDAIPLIQIEGKEQKTPLVLIVGNEVCGVDPGIIEISDRVISIPMVGKKNSYNVAIAFGIAASFLLYCQSFSQGSDSILPSI